MAMPGQSAKLNVRQSVLIVAKLPNLMFIECTVPTVCSTNGLCHMQFIACYCSKKPCQHKENLFPYLAAT